MENKNKTQHWFQIGGTLLFGLLILIACADMGSNSEIDTETKTQSDKLAMESLMKKHLDAVSNKDLETLRSTMHPDGKMQLLLPGTEHMDSVSSFMDYHTAWFSDTSAWTFTTKILNSQVGGDLGMAITEIVYAEPERNGAPYFNRMHVSYVLEKFEGKWYVIKDHASSIEKSTDEKK